MDNENLAKTDFTQYSVTVPTDRAPAELGSDRDRSLRSERHRRDRRTSSRTRPQFGTQQEHWNGFDFTVDARLKNGLFLQGGLSIGKTMTDNCDIVDDVPEALTVSGAAGIQPQVTGAAAGQVTPASFCHQETPFLTQYKGLVVLHAAVVRHPRQRHVAEPARSADRRDQRLQQHQPRRRSPRSARPFTNAQATINIIEPGVGLRRSAQPDRPALHEDRQRRQGPRRLQRGPLQRVQLGRGHR